MMGEGARSSLGNPRNNAEILIAELSAVDRALRSASDEVSALKTRVANNDSLADTYCSTMRSGTPSNGRAGFIASYVWGEGHRRQRDRGRRGTF